MSSPAASDKLQEYYRARAREYDRIYAKPERQGDLRKIESWLPGVLGRRNLLEVACGTGYWTQFLSPVGKRVTALDASSETLEIAKSRAANASVDFLVGDAFRLPVRSGEFDGAFAGFWISHVPRSRLPEFLDELHRTLVPGARVVFLDNRYVEGSSTPIAEADAVGNTYQLRRLSDGSMHRILKNFPSEGELRNALPRSCAGLRYHEWQYYWAIEYGLAAPQQLIASPEVLDGRNLQRTDHFASFAWLAGGNSVQRHGAIVTVERIDNIGIVVADLDAAIAFFTELGLQLEGRAPIEGDWADGVTGLRGMRVEIAMMRTPDGHGRLELSRFLAPPAVADHRNAPVNAFGYLRVMFTVDDIDDTLARLGKHGATVVGKVVQYGDTYSLCYIRGPEGILIGLAQELVKTA